MLCALLAAPASEASHRCRSRHSSTVVETSSGRIFEKFKRQSDGKRRNVLYGCLYRVGRIRRLGIYGGGGASSFIGFRSAQLEGRYASFVRVTQAHFDTTLYNEALVEVDLRSGETVFDSGGDDFIGPDGAEHQGNRIYRNLHKRNSSLAFIYVNRDDGVVKVRRVDATGDSVIDTDADVTFLRLSRDRRTVTWRKSSGVERSAPIS